MILWWFFWNGRVMWDGVWKFMLIGVDGGEVCFFNLFFDFLEK